MAFEILLIAIILYVIISAYFHFTFPEMRWDWDNIKAEKMSFPISFIWGTATAAHQVEGHCTNNWSEFEKGSKADGIPNIRNNQQSGIACDHWNKYQDDILMLEELGVSHYRLSLEWSKIEPEKDKFDDSVLNHYANVIDSLLKNNIVPYVTLHHFTNPIWFEEIGGFEKEENIECFLSFCKKSSVLVFLLDTYI